MTAQVSWMFLLQLNSQRTVFFHVWGWPGGCRKPAVAPGTGNSITGGTGELGRGEARYPGKMKTSSALDMLNRRQHLRSG